MCSGEKGGLPPNFRFSNPFKNQRFGERKLAGCPLFSRPRTSASGCQERKWTILPTRARHYAPTLRPARQRWRLLLIYRIFGFGSISASDRSRAGCCRNHTTAGGKSPLAPAGETVAERVRVWRHACYESCKSFAINLVQPGRRFQEGLFPVCFRCIQRRFRRCRTVASLSASHQAALSLKKNLAKWLFFDPVSALTYVRGNVGRDLRGTR